MTVQEGLQFGPFTTAYHDQLVTEAFKQSARQFVANHIVTQVDHDIVEIDGKFTPRATDDRNCGPNSAIKNCFQLDIRFFGKDSVDYSELQTQLWYRPDEAAFRVARGSSLYVWTPSRRLEYEAQKGAIQGMVDAILKNEIKTPFCPVCFANLTVVNTDNLFDTACPRKCFVYNFHKDQDGRLLHGHFNMYVPEEKNSRSLPRKQ